MSLTTSRKFFFITGLPRSKSAWLANYLTYGESFCWHDQLQHFTHLQDFRNYMEWTSASLVGHSDPANILVWRDLATMFPDATWIVVRRDLDDCYHSCRRINIHTEHERLWKLNDELKTLCRELKPVELSFDQPHLGEAAAAALGLPFNPQRAALLEHLQVQVEPTYLRNRINQLQQAAA